MTNREFFEAVVNGNVNAEVIAKANEEIAKIDARNATRTSAKEKKNAEVNEPLIAKATAYLMDCDEPATASAIAKAIEVSTSKATVIAKAVKGVVITDIKVKGGRSVKGYALAK